ncbi:glucose 1-dehydrogenase [Nonomuraea glycinis]|uniref:Short-chain dehydrogenase n=1 Tax=Nonomuraea glycinis TaxID=2047744 RepID=A0A918E317_9ACTN|nr:glucose 1-dehydrogenase [Nonomuraea glycinis]MCA2180327.1 glucose 1-dehydrogenase [Nonomuraea glycinis]GGP04000.1 short-chain dehydrogenase [Nonomuraea glycinis]
MRSTDKVVLITGGAGAIARVTAQAFAAEGATVVLAGRDPARLADAVKDIQAEGGRADQVIADVTSPEDSARMVETTVQRHGGLHVAFNNAGIIGDFAPLADLDSAAWSAVMDVNLTGVFLSMKYEIAYMKEHGGGAIVNMASNIGAHRRLEGLAAYAASKAGVSALSRAAAREYAGDGIRVNALSPGASDTAMSYRPGETTADRDARLAPHIPLGRVGDPGEIAAAVLWLAGAESSFVAGHDLVIDGGVTA